MKTVILIVSLLMPTFASAQLQWRISIKVFTGVGGTLPQTPAWGLGGFNLLQELSNSVNYANTVLGNTGRGYSWQLTEIVTVAGTTAPLPASTNSWFNLPVNAATQDDLDVKARGNTAGFQYRNNAINFYYVNAQSSGFGAYCAFPTENQNAILVAPDSFGDVLIHESGHFFGLQHTHNTQSYQNNGGTACTNSNPCTCAFALGGDDGISDTPLDNTCWSRDTISRSNFNGRAYATLNAGEQFFVNNTWSNVMSYHSPGNRFTDDQLDVITDNSSGGRFNVATGRTRFVDRTTGDFGQIGTSAFPFRTVADGIAAAIDGDIVLIRAGNYDEPRTYTKPVTLRATRGTVTIGGP
jgi:hypothetical protein